MISLNLFDHNPIGNDAFSNLLLVIGNDALPIQPFKDPCRLLLRSEAVGDGFQIQIGKTEVPRPPRSIDATNKPSLMVIPESLAVGLFDALGQCDKFLCPAGISQTCLQIRHGKKRGVKVNIEIGTFITKAKVIPVITRHAIHGAIASGIPDDGQPGLPLKCRELVLHGRSQFLQHRKPLGHITLIRTGG